MEDLTVTCPLVQNASRLISGFCSSPREFALDFLRTPPRGDALALWLTFGSTYTWYRDSHPTGFVPCTPHTFAPEVSREISSARLGLWQRTSTRSPAFDSRIAFSERSIVFPEPAQPPTFTRLVLLRLLNARICSSVRTSIFFPTSLNVLLIDSEKSGDVGGSRPKAGVSYSEVDRST
jgi:hypothetical protein